MNANKSVLILLAAMMIAVLSAPMVAAAGDPQVYYYTGDTCAVPTDEHFLSYPTGLLDYRLYVEINTWNRGDINPNGNHYTGIDDRHANWQLGMSKAEQEKLSVTKMVYCYTIPDPVDEGKFTVKAPSAAITAGVVGYFTNPDGSITFDGRTYEPRPGEGTGQYYELV